MRLSEYSKYRANRERAEAILRLLEGEPDKQMKDRDGRLTAKITKLLPRHLIAGRQGGSVGSSVISAEFRRMEDAGWVCLDVLGKRTFAMVLVDYPEDWVKPEVKENVEAVYTGPDFVMPSPEVDPNQLTFDDVAPVIVAREPHRVTTTQLRTLIHDEVQTAMDQWLQALIRTVTGL